MITVNAFQKTALLRAFSCFRLYSNDAAPEVMRRTDPDRKGHVIYMNKILAESIMALNKLGFSFDRIVAAMKTVNNFIENYALGKAEKMMEFRMVQDKIGEVIVAAIRKFGFKIEHYNTMYFPAVVSRHMPKGIQAAPDSDLEHEKQSRIRPEVGVGSKDISEAAQEANRRKGMVGWHTYTRDEKGRKKEVEVNQPAIKDANLRKLKKAFLDAAPGGSPGAMAAPTPQATAVPAPTAQAPQAAPSTDAKQIKDDADKAAQATDQLKKKMEELTKMLGGM